MIRRATEKDIKAVTDIYNDIHIAQEKGIVSTGWIREIYPTAETAEQSLQKGELFVEEDDGVIVGAAIINQQQAEAYKKAKWNYDASEHEVMVLHTLVISPKASGKGYGKSFISFYEQYAFSHNCRCLRMDTNIKNNHARAMYKKLGYSEVGIVPCIFNGIEGVKLVLLEKTI